MNKITAKILILTISLLLTFTVAEVLVRVSGFESVDVYEYDEKTGLNTLKPNSQFSSRTDCFDTIVHINSQGFNDSEFKLEKNAGVYRIAIIGDSFVEARNVSIEDSFQSILEKKLNEEIEGRSFEIYSFGIAGNGTFKNYLYLNQYVLKYNPDLVILSFLPFNDFRDDYLLSDKIFDNNGSIKTSLSFEKKIVSRSKFIAWLDYKIQVARTSENFNNFKNVFSKENTGTILPFDFQVFLKEYPAGWDNIWEMEYNLIRQFKKTAEENGSKFMIISLNDMWRAHPYLLETGEQYGAYLKDFELDLDKPEKILNTFLSEENIPYLNLKDSLGQRLEKEDILIFFHPCDGHWNVTGNQWAGEAIFEFFEKEENKNLLSNY
jgi:hypothetical protein